MKLLSPSQMDVEHIISFLSEDQRQKFFTSLAFYEKHRQRFFSIQTIKNFTDFLTEPPIDFPNTFPPTTYNPEDLKDYRLATNSLNHGSVACVVLAGGMGTRLGSPQPKGCLPISTIKNKSLYQLIVEKVVAASKKYRSNLPVIFFLSKGTEKKTLTHFNSNNFFGINRKFCFFCIQNDLPLLTSCGNTFLTGNGKIAFGPDGNGHLLKQLYESNILETLKTMGVKTLSIIPIDNPLAHPFDLPLLNFHLHHRADISAYAIERLFPEENIGLFIQKNNRTFVQEYSECTDQIRFAKKQSGKLLYPTGNCNLFCFDLSFATKVSSISLPLHLAKKRVEALFTKNNKLTRDYLTVYKFERFLLDLLPYAENVKLLLGDRRNIFYPLKEKQGLFSKDMVKKALLKKEQQLLTSLTGSNSYKKQLELSASCYYPTEEIIHTLKKMHPFKDYVDPSNHL